LGSFSELVLSFDFREETPPEVLAAFSALAKPVPDGAYWGPAPVLPAPVVEPTSNWEPEMFSEWAGAGANDPFASEPWRHDWASWLSQAMGRTPPSGALQWSTTKRWSFSCRCSFKTEPQSIAEFLRWLGSFIDAPSGGAGHLLGYIEGQAPRPYLLWAKDEVVTMEDLNPDDTWQYGGWVSPED
jgi:hypothetical protein